MQGHLSSFRLGLTRPVIVHKDEDYIPFRPLVVIPLTVHFLKTAMPILEKLDPYNFYIMYKLFRESTRAVNGQVVKDLSYLNRDLANTIIIDTVPDHVQLQPENAIILPKWSGDPKDKNLIALIPFLECKSLVRGYPPE